VTLDAPTLAARSSKRRKLPYYTGALVAWALLMACISLYYYQQANIARDKAVSLQASAQDLQREAPKIGVLVKQQATLQQTFDAVAKLGAQRDAWTQLLTALNEKIPDGVWITNLTPASSVTPASGTRGSAPSFNRSSGQSGAMADMPDGFVPAVGQVDMLVITGLYHANAKTQIVDPSRLRDFVNSLAALPYFDIDKNNITKTLVSFTSSETDPNVFAQKFSMNLKLKTPVLLKP
jgi:Tfp pilus assembly protein PilN